MTNAIYTDTLSSATPLPLRPVKHRVSIVLGPCRSWRGIAPGEDGVVVVDAENLNLIVRQHNDTLSDDSQTARNRGLLITDIQDVFE